jgi:hydroxymethylpyrimidine/phosphomethylpyrimidine kinase
MVKAIEPVTLAMVSAQIRLLFDTFPIAALKTGCSPTLGPIIECVAIRSKRFRQCAAPTVSRRDPVMIATPARPSRSRTRSYFTRSASFRSPGWSRRTDELAVLVGRSIGNLDEMRRAGQELVAQYRMAFLLKGAHLRESLATDLLITPSGDVSEFSAPFIPGISTHGTGCTLSAAIAAGIARGSR